MSFLTVLSGLTCSLIAIGGSHFIIINVINYKWWDLDALVR